MKNSVLSLALSAILLASIGCKKEEAPVFDEVCSVLEEIQSKEVAKAAIIGDWEWVQTESPRRGSETTLQTPQSTGKQKTYRFTEERFVILEDNRVIFDSPYSIKYRGEGTNTVDPGLMLHTYWPATDSSPTFLIRSILVMDQGQFCMKIINSYDDAGDNVTLRKIVKTN
jgi:hypothetical protein